MAKRVEKFVTPIRVGFFVLAAIVAFSVFVQIVSTRGISRSDSYELYALFDDVIGLEKKSPVQIAGIDIGRIKTVRLFRGKAKVILEIDGDVEIYEDASIDKVSISLLGDYKLAVEPGDSSRRKLRSGDEITRVSSLSNVDAVVAEVRDIAEAMSNLIAGTPDKPAPLQAIVADVQSTAAAARMVLEEVSKNIGANTSSLNRILSNIESFTGDLEALSTANGSDVQAIILDARAISSSLKVTAQSLEALIAGQDEAEIKESVKSLRETLNTMNRSLENVASITQKIDQGDGTLGKLVNDEDIHENLSETAEGISSIVGGLARLKTWVNLRSEFQFRTGATKNYVQFILQPKEDKYYIFEVVDDPRGVRETVIEDVESTSPEFGRAFQFRERRTTTTDALSFSLMFAKRYYWLGLRFGIIEGTGGVGADFHFLKDRLELYFDLNRFGEEARRPRAKGLALVEMIPHIYIHGGIDDFLNPGTVDYFLGAGVRFTDDDLKTILPFTGGAAGVTGAN